MRMRESFGIITLRKRNRVLDGSAVIYGSASELQAALDYDFSEEKKFSHKNLTMDEVIHHLALFVSRLWQIHAFAEGNTRTTAVFFVLLGLMWRMIFLRRMHGISGMRLYNDLKNGIAETTEYLELFLRNLLLDEDYELQNRSMLISGALK